MKNKKPKNQFPQGWNLARVKKVIAYYDNQPEQEAVEEIEAAMPLSSEWVMAIPKPLVPQVRKLIEEYRRKRKRRKGKK